MVNQVVYDYLKRYSDSYTFEDLRRKILDAGYTQVDVDEAIKKIQEESLEPQSETTPKPPEKNISSTSLPPNTTGTNPSFLFKLSGIAGLLVIFIFPLLIIVNDFFKDILVMVLLFLSILFFLGFIYVGKKYNRLLITTSSWFFILCLLGFFLLYIGIRVYPAFFPPSFVSIDSFVADPLSTLLGLGTLLLGIVFGFIGLFVLFGVLLGIGILHLRDEVPFSGVTGIITLIGFSTLLIGIGFFVLPLVLIFQSLILFKESSR